MPGATTNRTPRAFVKDPAAWMDRLRHCNIYGHEPGTIYSLSQAALLSDF